MLSLTVAHRYAKGLLDAVSSVAPGQEGVIQEQLSGLVEAVEGHDALKLVVANPAVSAQQKQAIFRKISETLGVSDLLARFVEVVADKKRLDHLALMVQAYGKLLDEHVGIVRAEVTTSTALNPGQVAQLENSLRQATGAEVRISRRTDPELLGGVVTRIGDVVYDGSLRGHLERIRQRLER